MFITNLSQNKYELGSKLDYPVIYKHELDELRRLYHMYENNGVPVSELHIKFNHLRFNFEYIDCFTNVRDVACGFYDVDYEGPVMYIDTVSEYEQWPGETREDYGWREDFIHPVLIDKGKLWYPEYWACVYDDNPWTEEDDRKWTSMKSWDSFDEWIDYIEKCLSEDKILKD